MRYFNTLTLTCENVELTVAKNNIVTHFPPPPPLLSFSVGPVDPSVENPGKNTEIEDNAYIIFLGGRGVNKV